MKGRRPQWPRGLRPGPAAVGFLGLRVRIPPPGAWNSVSCECYVLSRRGFCDGLITRPEESYRMWSWSLDNEEALAHWDCCDMGGGEGVNKCQTLHRARQLYHTESLHLPGQPSIETVIQETQSANIQRFRCYLQEKWLPKRDLYCQKKLFLGKGCMAKLCTQCSTGASWHRTYLSVRWWHQGWHCRYTPCPFLRSVADWSTGACRCLQAWSRCSLCLALGRRSRMPVACRQSAKRIDGSLYSKLCKFGCRAKLSCPHAHHEGTSMSGGIPPLTFTSKPLCSRGKREGSWGNTNNSAGFAEERKIWHSCLESTHDPPAFQLTG